MVGGDGRREDDGVDPIVLDDVRELRRRSDSGVPPGERCELFRARIADADDLGVLELNEIPNEVGPPVPEPDDGDAKRAGAQRVPFGRKTCSGVFRSSMRSPLNDQLRA